MKKDRVISHRTYSGDICQRLHHEENIANFLPDIVVILKKIRYTKKNGIWRFTWHEQ